MVGFGFSREAAQANARLAAACQPYVDRLLAIPAGQAPEAEAEAVLEVMRGAPPSVFIFMDERPGYFGGDYSRWHSKLRRVRNSPRFAPLMFNGWGPDRLPRQPARPRA